MGTATFERDTFVAVVSGLGEPIADCVSPLPDPVAAVLG
jgi:hypothetical protein